MWKKSKRKRKIWSRNCSCMNNDNQLSLIQELFKRCSERMESMKTSKKVYWSHLKWTQANILESFQMFKHSLNKESSHNAMLNFLYNFHNCFIFVTSTVLRTMKTSFEIWGKLERWWQPPPPSTSSLSRLHILFFKPPYQNCCFNLNWMWKYLAFNQ